MKSVTNNEGFLTEARLPQQKNISGTKGVIYFEK